ncbi:MAG: pyridoxal phosphate-dependent aminotransferase [Mogibacterium sp.]|nr:pyridoxal phosphate-dependent aminotransferase [Mogibacterium sp.]
MSLLKYVDRKNTNCAKWDGLEHSFSRGDLLAMWVADMDFEVPECVSDALKSYIEMGAFGYYIPPADYFNAFIDWERRYHGYEVKREWMRFAPGVVPAFNWLVQILAGEGEAVAVMPPVYYPFMKAVENNDRRLVEVPLLLTDAGYAMDYESFEEAIVREDVKAFIFCSPHNPIGRVWKKDEIRRVLDICKRHNVYVISDEIHHDIIMSGHTHIPSATVSTSYDDILVTLTAATKTFNLAAVQNSIVIIPDENIRAKWDAFAQGISVTGGNAFGYVAVQAAYERGRPWFEELLGVVEGNYKYLRDRLEAELPEVRVADLEGTYLMWIDLSAYVNTEEDTQELMENKCGIAVDYGAWFGGNKYAGCIRVNLATSRENIETAADRIIKALKQS